MAELTTPAYRIPDEETIQAIIRHVMKVSKTVRSQTLFHKLIAERLRENGSDLLLKLSPQRLRRIAVGMPGMRLTIHCRDSNETFRRRLCPVCGSEMEIIKNQTLYGWTVNTGKLCRSCNYWTGSRMRKPVRYVFTYDEEKRG